MLVYLNFNIVTSNIDIYIDIYKDIFLQLQTLDPGSSLHIIVFHFGTKIIEFRTKKVLYTNTFTYKYIYSKSFTYKKKLTHRSFLHTYFFTHSCFSQKLLHTGALADIFIKKQSINNYR